MRIAGPEGAGRLRVNGRLESLRFFCPRFCHRYNVAGGLGEGAGECLFGDEAGFNGGTDFVGIG